MIGKRIYLLGKISLVGFAAHNDIVRPLTDYY